MVQHENQKHELQKFLSLIRRAFKTGNVNGAKIRKFFEYIVLHRRITVLGNVLSLRYICNLQTFEKA